MLARENLGSPLPPPGGVRLVVCASEASALWLEASALWFGMGEPFVVGSERSEPHYVCIFGNKNIEFYCRHWLASLANISL